MVSRKTAHPLCISNTTQKDHFWRQQPPYKTTTVQELKNKSTLISNRAYGRVYKYENIWVGDIKAGLPTSFENGTVGFKVNKTWINNSNANESLVTLQWFNTTWEPLDTEKTGEDTNYLYFESKTPGYSSFAISEYTGEVDKNGTQVKLQDALIGLESAGKVGMNGSVNRSKAQEAAIPVLNKNTCNRRSKILIVRNHFYLYWFLLFGMRRKNTWLSKFDSFLFVNKFNNFTWCWFMELSSRSVHIYL
jgi:PGF-pre-PGF domain-containing protein